MALLLILGLATSPIPAEELTHQAGPVEVIGRYREFLDSRLKLYDSQVVFTVEDPAHASVILGLTPAKDNLLITGHFVEQELFRVGTIAQGPSDVAILGEKAAETPDTSEALLALGKTARARARRFKDAELEEAANGLIRKGFTARKREGDQDDVAAHLAWVTEMVSVLNDTEWAIREAQEMLARRPGLEEPEQLLRSLDCVKWQGTWLARPEFMRRHGLVRVEDRWVHPRELSFAEACAKAEAIRKSQQILRKHTDQYYQMHVEQGKLLPGMTRREAVAAWGFPDAVRRSRQQTGVVDQWCYGERLVYFVDDHVAILPPDPEQTPSDARDGARSEEDRP